MRELTSNVRVGRRLKRAQSITNDEDAGAKCSEAAINDRRDRQQRTNAVQTEAPDEHGTIGVMAQNPSGVAQ